MTQNQHNKSVLIIGVMVALVLAVRLSSIVFPQRTGTVDPHINLAENRAREIAERQRQQQVAAFIAVSEGEVSRTEQRIREATALATAASLFAASESLGSRAPTCVTALLFGVNSAGLMPPGMQLLDSQGEVTCSHGRLLVRYRPEPLGVEVVSIGKVPLDGPALLVRLPANGIGGTNQLGAGLYLATSLDNITVPAPFAHEAEVVALGFAPEPLRAAKLVRP